MTIWLESQQCSRLMEHENVPVNGVSGLVFPCPFQCLRQVVVQDNSFASKRSDLERFLLRLDLKWEHPFELLPGRFKCFFCTRCSLFLFVDLLAQLLDLCLRVLNDLS